MTRQGWAQPVLAGLDLAKKKYSFPFLIQILKIYSLALELGIPYFLGYTIFTNARVGNIRR